MLQLKKKKERIVIQKKKRQVHACMVQIPLKTEIFFRVLILQQSGCVDTVTARIFSFI